MSSHDPYSPSSARTTPLPAKGALPTARLRRVGMSERAIMALAAVWAGMTAEEREWESDGISLQSDVDLAAWVATLEPPDNTATVILSWIDAHDLPVLAAQVALAAEKQSDQPRSSLITRLERLAG